MKTWLILCLFGFLSCGKTDSISDESHTIMKRNVEPYSYQPQYPVPSGMYQPSSYYQPYSCPTCNKTQDCNKCDMYDRPCTKDQHLTGCIVQGCTSADTLLIDYTCYCDPYFPQGCVFPMDGETPCNNEVDTFICKCNGPRKSPTWCSLRFCDPGELPTKTTTCVCGSTPDTQPCGCIRQSVSGQINQLNTIRESGVGGGRQQVVVVD